MRNSQLTLRCTKVWTMAVLALALAAAPLAGAIADTRGFLESIKKHSLLTSTVPENGDQNPYAIVVAPVSVGKI
jgi:hypothetical protein